LTLIGALEGKDETITRIGELLVKIPIDPFLSRAIVEALIFERILGHEKYSKHYQQLSTQEIQSIPEKSLVETVTVILSLLINFSNLFFIRFDAR